MYRHPEQRCLKKSLGSPVHGGVVEASALESRARQRVRVGPDRVDRRGDSLFVRAACEMPDWRISEFRRTAVHFRGSRYAVTEHRLEQDGQHVYVLELWLEDRGSRPGHELEYDEAYVEARDRIRRARSRSDVLAFVAAPFTPVIGLLPSGVKASWHGAIGIHPRTATGASIFLEYLIALVCMALALIHLVSGASEMTAELRFVFWLAPLVLLDAAMRANSASDDSPRCYGFYEWLFRRLVDGQPRR